MHITGQFPSSASFKNPTTFLKLILVPPLSETLQPNVRVHRKKLIPIPTFHNVVDFLNFQRKEMSNNTHLFGRTFRSRKTCNILQHTVWELTDTSRRPSHALYCDAMSC